MINKNTLFKIIGTILALAILLIAPRYLFPSRGEKGEGAFTFILYDELGDKKLEDEIHFVRDDDQKATLLELLIENDYDVYCANMWYQQTKNCDSFTIGNYGQIVLTIEGVETNWTDYFLCFYVNGEIADLGAGHIEPNNGDIIEVRKEAVHEN